MDIEKAVLRVFRNLRIPSGGGLRHSMLVKEWADMSLRRGDLDSGLKRLTALCYLRPERTPDGEIVFFTPAGYEHAEHLFEHPVQNLVMSLRMRIAAIMRRDRAGASRPLPRRRLADRIAPSAL